MPSTIYGDPNVSKDSVLVRARNWTFYWEASRQPICRTLCLQNSEGAPEVYNADDENSAILTELVTTPFAVMFTTNYTLEASQRKPPSPMSLVFRAACNFGDSAKLL